MAEHLPIDVLKYIFFELDVNILYFVSQVCHRWRRVVFTKPRLRFFVHDIIRFCATHKYLELLNWLHDRFPHRRFWQDHKKLHEIVACTGDISTFYWTLLLDCKYSHNFYSHAAEHGHFHLIEHGLQLGIPLQPEDLVIAAARYGNLEMVEFFRAKNNGSWPGTVLYAAASNGHWDLLKWLYSAGCRQLNLWFSDKDVGPVVAKKGNLEVLKWMQENDLYINEGSATEQAAESGHFEVVKWLCQNTEIESKPLASYALDGGHLDIFHWLIDNGFNSKNNYCDAAVKLGLEVLKYARSLGFSWGEHSYWYAIEAGDLEMVKWLHCNKCPKIENYEGSSTVCYMAAKLGQLEILKFLHSVCEEEPECTWFDISEISSCAVLYGQIDVLKWIKEISSSKTELDKNKRKKFNWKETWELAKMAAYFGELEILEWLLENDCSWDSNLCAIAATQGYVNILQWADENGYKWDRKKDNYTEIPGLYNRPIKLTPEPHAEALKQLKSYSESPWDLTLSEKNTYKEIVQFAQDSGCPWNGNIPTRNNEILDWLEKKKWCNFNSKTIIDVVDQDSEISEETETTSTYYETDSCSDAEFELLDGLTFPDVEDDFNDEMSEEPYYIPNDCFMNEFE